MNIKVELNDFRRQWETVEHDVLDAVKRVGVRGWYILGERVSSFEASLSRAWPMTYCVGVGNGLDALEIGLRCLDLKPGTKVLTTPLSAFATTLAIVRAGGVPVFVDVDDSGLIDLNKCHSVLSQRSDIRYLLVVHLYGHALELDVLENLRDEFDLKLVEDCAQSIGAQSNNRSTGSVGDVAATSFYPTKNLGAMGDGGALLTNSAKIAEMAQVLRHYGQTSTYVHDQIGLNSRLDELHAAVLDDVMLPRLSQWTARRRAIAERFLMEIKNPCIKFPLIPAGSCSCWHLFPVLVKPEQRPAFVTHMKDRGVMTGCHYPKLIVEQRALTGCGYRFEVSGELANAKRFSCSEVSLPIHPFLTDEEVSHVVTCCNAWSAM